MFRFHGVGGLSSQGLAAVRRHRSFSPIWSWEGLGAWGFNRRSLPLNVWPCFLPLPRKRSDAGIVGKPQP